MTTLKLNESEPLEINLMFQGLLCPECNHAIDTNGHCLCKSSFGIEESEFDGCDPDYYED